MPCNLISAGGVCPLVVVIIDETILTCLVHIVNLDMFIQVFCAFVWFVTVYVLERPISVMGPL